MTRNTRALFLAVVALTVFGSTVAQAQSATTIPSEQPSLMKGVRPVGMGNGFIAMPGEDENAMFYNPAAINDYEKKFHFRFLSPVGDFSPGIIGLVQDVFDLADDIDAAATDAAKTRVFRDFVNAHIGQFETVRVAFPVVTVMHKWFAVSVLADSRSTISFRNRAFTNIEINSVSDFGGVLGTAYNFKDWLGIDQNLQAGLDLKILHRYAIDKVVTSNDIVNSADFGDAIPRIRATGVGVDIGIKADFPTFGAHWLEVVKPTVALTYQDIGNTRFSGAVPNTPQSLTVGFALHPMIGEKWQLHFVNDIRDLNHNNGFLRKWNIGAEVQAPLMWNFFRPAVRIGGNQGYISAGATLDFKYAKLEFATYGEEASKFSSQKQLRRIAFNLSFGF